jgi:hypothetical protein
MPATTPETRRRLIAARDSMTGAAAALRESGTRTSPAFLIVGAQKAGTTFLHHELVRHPQVRAPLTKEIHYLDDHFARGLAWYLGHFPASNSVITGESSPGYLFHPHAARRARQLLPGVRAIVLLRDPVRRAYSHFQHERRLGFESETSFARAVEREPERTRHELERLRNEPHYVSHAARHFTYVTRGEYAEQLRRWTEALGDDRVKVVFSSDLFGSPRAVLDEVERFLGLDPWQPYELGPNDMASTAPPLEPGIDRDLREHYRRHDAELTELLGRAPGWAA